MILETGAGLSTADTYVDPTAAAAVDYMANHLHAAAWVAASAPDKVRAVIMATRTLDTAFEWKGYAVSTEQALGWPRRVTATRRLTIPDDAVPTRVWQATLEMAQSLLVTDRTTDVAAQGVNKIALGDGALSLDLTPPASSPPASMVPNYISAMLRDYGEMDVGGPMARLERR